MTSTEAYHGTQHKPIQTFIKSCLTSCQLTRGFAVVITPEDLIKCNSCSLQLI